MKNILFVISTLTGGGAERTVSILSQYFGEDIKCSVLLNSESKNDYEFHGDVITLGMKPKVKKTLLYQAKAAIKRYFVLKKLKRTFKYDAVISFMESANILNVITGVNDTKVILSVRNVLSEEYKGIYKLILWAVKFLYKKADYIVALSEGSRGDLIGNLQVPMNKAITIYNGYDLNKIVSKTQTTRNNFITMGRLVPQKGQWHLVRAFSEVVKTHPEAKLQILGQGYLAKEINKLIEAYGLDKNIEMVGYVSNTTDFLRNADCFVFPSVYEGFGNAIIEALMSGLPVIVSDFSVAREILAPNIDRTYIVDNVYEGEFGILTPCNNNIIYDSNVPLDNAEKKLSQAIIYYIEGKIGNKYDDKNRFDCLKRFSIDETTSEWKELL